MSTSLQLTRSSGTYTYYLNETLIRAQGPEPDFDYRNSQGTIVVTLPPQSLPPPANLAGNATGSGNFSLSWSPVANATSYTVRGGLIGENVGSTTSRNFSGHPHGYYYFDVKACNSSVCSAWSTAIGLQITNIPATPTLTAPPTPNSGNYSLSWSQSVGADRYTVTEVANGGSPATYPHASSPLAFADKAAGTYVYRVQACNADGCSAQSSSVTVQVIRIPAPPAVTATANNFAGSYTVYWSSVSATSYEARRRERNSDGSYSGWMSQGTTTAGSRTFTDSARGIYEYQATACNSMGCSAWSASTEVKVETLANVIAAPSIQPATAAGALGFGTDVSSGGDSLITIPLQSPSGVNGLQPSLALTYSSGASQQAIDLKEAPETLAGGWRLSGLSRIRRCRMLVGGEVALSTDDRLCLDGMPLQLKTGASYWAMGAEYRTFPNTGIKVVANGSYDNRSFQVFLPDGRVRTYGDTPESRVTPVGAGSATHFHTWGMTEEWDEFGNFMTIYWAMSPVYGSNYPTLIEYNDARIEFFFYAGPLDALTQGMGLQASAAQPLLLHTIRMQRGTHRVREYFFERDAWQVTKVQMCGYNESGASARCLAPLQFTWSSYQLKPPPELEYASAITAANNGLGDVTTFGYQVGPTFSTEPEANQGWFGTYARPANVTLQEARVRLFANARTTPDGRGGSLSQGYSYLGLPLYDTAGMGYVGFPMSYVSTILPAFDAATGTNQPVTISMARQHKLERGLYGQVVRTETTLNRGTTSQLLGRREVDIRLDTSNTVTAPRVYSWNYDLNSAGAAQWRNASVTTLDYCYRVLTVPSTCPTTGTATEFVGQVIATSRYGTSLSPSGTVTGATWASVGTRSISGQLNHRAKTTNLINGTSPWTVGFATYVRQYFGVTGVITSMNLDTSIVRLNTSSVRPLSATFLPGDAEFALTQVWDYDSLGHVTQQTTSGADITTRSQLFGDYAFNGNVAPRTLTNAKSQTTSLTYDARFSTPKSATDPNGLTGYVDRDEFGRVVRTTQPDGAITDVVYESCVFANCGMISWGTPRMRVTRTTTNNGQVVPITRTYLDGLGRVLLTEMEAFNSADGWSRVATQYDNAGRVSGQSMPYYATGGTLYWQTTDYDFLSRPARMTRTKGGTLRQTYEATAVGQLTVTTTDSANTLVKVGVYNALGQLTSTVDGSGTSDAVTTTYTYTPQGDMDVVRVNSVQVADLDYDKAGNRNRLVDASSGTTLFNFDSLGQLQTSTDANGKITRYSYDVLGRVIERVDAQGTAGEVTNTWVWDTKPFGVGSLASRSSGGKFSEVYVYDTLGRLERSTMSPTVAGFVGSASYIIEYDYDVQGRPSSTTYPGNAIFTKHYTAQGYVDQLKKGATVLEQYGSMDALGNVTQMSFNNNLNTVRAYDPRTGELATQMTGSAGSPKSMQDMALTWRQDGMLQQRTLLRGTPATADDFVETFAYDSLNRLDSAAAVMPGTGARTRTQDYDRYGNLTVMSSSVAGDRNVAGYTFGTASRPHQLTSVTIGGVATSLMHDAAGNVTRYTPASGDNTFIAYDGANQATRITLGSSLDAATPTARDDFWYDPDGARYLRKETWQSGSTQHSRWVLYLEGGTFEEVRTPTDPTVDYYQKIQVTPTIQYRLTRTKAGAISSTYDYLHRDHLGSVDRVTNTAGTLVHRLSYDAFGARREGLWTSDLTSASLNALLADNSRNTSRGFTDHEHLDRTGIVHMNGRIYDPRIGRFLQPDPIVTDPADSQSYNRYSYVGNQPLLFTDPSGFDAVPADTERVIVHGSRLGGDAAATATYGGGRDNLFAEGAVTYITVINGESTQVTIQPLPLDGYVPPPVPSRNARKGKSSIRIGGRPSSSGGGELMLEDTLSSVSGFTYLRNEEPAGLSALRRAHPALQQLENDLWEASLPGSFGLFLQKVGLPKLSGAREHAALIFQNQSDPNLLIFRQYAASADMPNSISGDPTAPPGFTLIAIFHTHPFIYRTGNARGPSRADFDTASRKPDAFHYIRSLGQAGSPYPGEWYYYGSSAVAP